MKSGCLYRWRVELSFFLFLLYLLYTAERTFQLSMIDRIAAPFLKGKLAK
jgi:hypothetical protein